MISSWWFLWMMFMFLLLVTPVSYGWGYRGWGPPYPSYFQRRRELRSTGASGAFNHYSWGWGGDFVWLILLVGIFWVATALWWPMWR
jgi:hypothetical protein